MKVLTRLSKILFLFEPELAHEIGMKILKILIKFRAIPRFLPSNPTNVATITFPNRVGIAGGFDKNADYLAELMYLGFGHVEIGTITPKPQSGNACPRIFRSIKNQSIINRMGFNNKGADYIENKLKKYKPTGLVVGINIGKNKDTPLEKASADYKYSLSKLYKYADYFTINISSPNTPDLRTLQSKEYLPNLLEEIKNLQIELSDTYNKYKPIFIKISPDMTESDFFEFLNNFQTKPLDGLVISNTTLERPSILGRLGEEKGGLSGKLLFEKSTKMLSLARNHLPKNVVIIGVGGITSLETARAKLEAGADIIQVFTGFIYRSFELLDELKDL